MIVPSAYRAPRWLPGGHLQTIYPAVFLRGPRAGYRRERWETPDGDFVDVDWTSPVVNRAGANAGAGAPLLALFHGLEGSSTSHYAHALMAHVCAIGWRGVVVHFRGCSGEANRLARAYHSGDSAEIDWMLRRLRTHAVGPLFAAGVSLGGNALLKWLGEQAAAAADVITGAAAVSAPLDLMTAGEALGRGFNLVYTRQFLSTLKRKSIAKLAAHPQIYDATLVRTARTLRAFDNVVTAPLHGFRDTDDYWMRASSKPWLAHIRVPTLLVNARNDPFLPQQALPAGHEVSQFVTCDFPEEGGHVGFVAGPFPGHLDWLPRRIIDFLRHSGCALADSQAPSRSKTPFSNPKDPQS